MSELQNSGDYWYYTGEQGSWGYNSGKLTPIHIVEENKIASPTSNDTNLVESGNLTT